jgi:hypothetical protein
LAQAANSSGVGVWPMSAAQRRTMKPSIIFEALCFGFGEPSMTSLYKKYFQKLQENLFSSSSFYRLLLLSHNDGFARLAKIPEVSLHGMR